MVALGRLPEDSSHLYVIWIISNRTQHCKFWISVISRNQHCPEWSTLENCRCIKFELQADDQTRSEVIISETSKLDFRQVEKKRIRDIRPGDRVILEGVERVVIDVSFYR